MKFSSYRSCFSRRHATAHEPRSLGFRIPRCPRIIIPSSSSTVSGPHACPVGRTLLPNKEQGQASRKNGLDSVISNRHRCHLYFQLLARYRIREAFQTVPHTYERRAWTEETPYVTIVVVKALKKDRGVCCGMGTLWWSLSQNPIRGQIWLDRE
ncbi:hypothetical protein BDV98DRAFT_407542 [Pterulicium gracile]|uniref:Uncharacterized protein n=1 Tax=Pterulicium gracile TaxID=1884261 RepID=A0A5C3QPZ5_9AGAR|nr:hypothetical protein BDV98DRAFT_407542 [Pterula gracilis]